jgi:hypothetical protein
MSSELCRAVSCEAGLLRLLDHQVGMILLAFLFANTDLAKKVLTKSDLFVLNVGMMTSQAETYAAVLESSLRSTESLGEAGGLCMLDFVGRAWLVPLAILHAACLLP